MEDKVEAGVGVDKVETVVGVDKLVMVDKVEVVPLDW